MESKFQTFLKDAKTSGIDWLKSQLVMSLITFVLLIIGLLIIDNLIIGFASVPVIILISLGIAIADFIPVIGVSTCMLPWAVIAALLGNTKLGLSIFAVFVVIMIIKQFLEPLVRGKSLGMSPIEEILASLGGYVVLGMNPIGFLLGPLIYIIGKKTYHKFAKSQTIEEKTTESVVAPRPEAPKSTDTDKSIDITNEVE